MQHSFRNLLFCLVTPLAFIADMSHSSERTKPREIEVLSGDWYVFEPKFSTGSLACKVHLSQTSIGQGFAAGQEHCQAPFDTVAGWAFEDNRIRIFDKAGKAVAELGGSINRLSGKIDESLEEVILEKVEAASDAKNIKKAVSDFGCVFHGYTQDCSLPSREISDPAPLEGRRVRTLTKLNVRAHPSVTAKVLGYVDMDVELSTDYCLRTSSELWCKATFGDKSGWLTSTALREKKWAVRTLAFLETQTDRP